MRAPALARVVDTLGLGRAPVSHVRRHSIRNAVLRLLYTRPMSKVTKGESARRRVLRSAAKGQTGHLLGHWSSGQEMILERFDHLQRATKGRRSVITHQNHRRLSNPNLCHSHLLSDRALRGTLRLGALLNRYHNPKSKACCLRMTMTILSVDARVLDSMRMKKPLVHRSSFCPNNLSSYPMFGLFLPSM